MFSKVVTKLINTWQGVRVLACPGVQLIAKAHVQLALFLGESGRDVYQLLGAQQFDTQGYVHLATCWQFLHPGDGPTSCNIAQYLLCVQECRSQSAIVTELKSSSQNYIEVS